MFKAMLSTKYLLTIGGFIGGLVLLGAGCSDDGSGGFFPTTTDGNTTTTTSTPTTTTSTPTTTTSTPTSTTSTTSTPVSTSTVEIRNFSFQPRTITISRGTTVTWTQRDQVAHTVTADNGSYDSGLLQQGQTYSRTFNDVGTSTYYCKPHPNMKGTIIVR